MRISCPKNVRDIITIIYHIFSSVPFDVCLYRQQLNIRRYNYTQIGESNILTFVYLESRLSAN